MQANQASRQWPDDNKGKEGVSERAERHEIHRHGNHTSGYQSRRVGE